MSDRGKKKKKGEKNTKAAKTKWTKKEIVILITSIVALFIVIGYFIAFPKTLSNRIVETIVDVGCALIAIALVIIPILLKLKKGIRIKYKARIISVICVVFLFVSAQAIIISNNKNEENSNNTAVVNKTEIDEPVNISFAINFNDSLFGAYTATELKNNMLILTAQIIEAIKNGKAVNLEDDTGNYQLYEFYVLQAHDYELAYEKFNEYKIFEKQNQSERIAYIDISIDLRKSADGAYKTYDNKRCVALRYNDKGYELCRIGNVNEAIAAYKSAIEYGVGALCVQFMTKGKSDSDTGSIIDAIIRGYTGITELTTEDNGEYKRAKILIEIFKEIKKKL